MAEEAGERGSTGTAVDLVLLGAECPGDRALAGTAGAAAAAALFGEAVRGALMDAGDDRCRIVRAEPDDDANALHTAVRQGAERSGRLLVVYLAGQLVQDPRRRRPVLAVAGSGRDDAHRHGLPLDWVLSAMVHGGHAESLLVLDAVADRADWDAWRTGEEAGAGPAGLPADPGVALWGRLARYGAPRLRRWTSAPAAQGGAGAGGFARALAGALEAGVPGLPAALDPAALHAALGPGTDVGGAGSAGGAVRAIPPPPASRLLLRNRAALRGALSPDQLPPALRDALTRRDEATG